LLLLGWLVLFPTALLTALVLWNMMSWSRVATHFKAKSLPSVSILIPARNEESNIEDCIESALGAGERVLEILVYDDHSEDNTAITVKKYSEKDPRVRLLAPLPLPKGWCGKPFACAQLAENAQGEWLFFLDADTRVTRAGADFLVANALEREVSFLACWPKIICSSLWEKLLMPMLNFSVFTMFPAKVAEHDFRPSLGLAHGACLLMKRDVYGKIGGHEAVRNEIFEDTALARVWRKAGERGICLDGQDIASVRMYRSFQEIWYGFQKNFFPSFKHPVNFWVFLFFHGWCFLSPFVFAPLATLLAAPSWTLWASVMCVFIMRGAMAFRFRYPLWSCLLHPVAEILLLALGVSSWYRCFSGKGIVWKGRVYSGNPLD